MVNVCVCVCVCVCVKRVLAVLAAPMLALLTGYRQGKARQVYLYSTFHTQW